MDRATESKKSQRQDVVYVFKKVLGRQFRWCGLKEEFREVNEFHLEEYMSLSSGLPKCLDHVFQSNCCDIAVQLTLHIFVFFSRSCAFKKQADYF